MRRIPIAEIETVDPEVRDTTHFGKLGHLTARHTRVSYARSTTRGQRSLSACASRPHTMAASQR